MVASIKPHRDAIGLSDGLLLIDGSWGPAAEGQAWSHVHPATGEEVASFPTADAADVDRAVRAARRAFDEGPWPRARATERIRVLRRIAFGVCTSIMNRSPWILRLPNRRTFKYCGRWMLCGNGDQGNQPKRARVP